MKTQLNTTWEIIRQAVSQWQQDRAMELGAAISFYAIISLAPLITVTLSVASIFYGREALRGELVTQVSGLIGEAGAEVVQTILANASKSQSGFFAAVGLFMLFLGASAVFLQLQSALNAVWNVAPRTDLPFTHTVRVRLLSMGLVVSVAFVLLLSMALSAVLAALQSFMEGLSPGMTFFWQTTNLVVSIGISTLLFGAIFKMLPDAIIDWRDVWVGGLITAVLFNVGKLGIGFYLGRSAVGSAYGATGSLITLLLWIYYSSVVVLLGAEFAQVCARRFGAGIRPAAHAYRTSSVRLPVDTDGRPILTGEQRDEVQDRVS